MVGSTRKVPFLVLGPFVPKGRKSTFLVNTSDVINTDGIRNRNRRVPCGGNLSGHVSTEMVGSF